MIQYKILSMNSDLTQDKEKLSLSVCELEYSWQLLNYIKLTCLAPSTLHVEVNCNKPAYY